MLEEILKGILLSKLDDIFPGANWARYQTACCLTFIDYPECRLTRLTRTHHGSRPPRLNWQELIAGEIKAERKAEPPYHRGFGLCGKSGDGLRSAFSGPSRGTVPALGAEKEAQYCG